MSVLWDFAAHMMFVWSLMTVIFDEFAVLNGKVRYMKAIMYAIIYCTEVCEDIPLYRNYIKLW